MHIKRKTSQHRRDFTAIYACEHCDLEVAGSGYDDLNFHEYVVPRMICSSCKRTAEAGSPVTRPDVPAHVVI